MSDTALLKELFPGPVVSCSSRIQDYSASLFQEELAIIANAVEKRRMEFSSGRFCAGKAMQQLCQASVPILQRNNGEPVWPKETVGSISHSLHWAGAAVSRSDQIYALGLDIETIDRIKAPILKRIITDKEQSLLNSKTGKTRQIYTALIFSAKEAFYKAISPRYGGTLRFKDISIILHDSTSEFKITPTAPLNRFLQFYPDPICRYFILKGDIFTAITYPAFINPL